MQLSFSVSVGFMCFLLLFSLCRYFSISFYVCLFMPKTERGATQIECQRKNLALFIPFFLLSVSLCAVCVCLKTRQTKLMVLTICTRERTHKHTHTQPDNWCSMLIWKCLPHHFAAFLWISSGVFSFFPFFIAAAKVLI